jgi:16S rRNA (guanine966-N2)-methyltransferase
LTPRNAQKVRIIGGRDRGRRLHFPDLPGLRPTPDRVRETLFNWLGQELPGRRCLDLYAGTGALSFEAASRGAALAVAVERHRSAFEAIRANAALLGSAAVEIHCADARAHLARENRLFDVVFLDPPFDEDPWPWLLPACLSRLADDGRIYAEAAHGLEPAAGLETVRRDKAGQVHYHLFARKAPG